MAQTTTASGGATQNFQAAPSSRPLRLVAAAGTGRDPAAVPAACFEAAFAAAQEALCVLDDDRYCVAANPAAERLFGSEALVGRRADDFAPPQLRELLSRSWAAFLVDGRATGETELARPDGSSIEVKFTAVAGVAPGRNVSVLEALGDASAAAPDARVALLLRGGRHAAGAALRGARILVVDGDDARRAHLARLLIRLGANVQVAHDAEGALGELQAAARLSRFYDVALVDFGLPGASGWAMRAIGTEKSPCAPEIVAMTTAGERRAAAAIVELAGFVTKPVLDERLIDELARVVTLVVSARSGTAPPPASHHRYSGRVLVAEDNPANESIAVGLLSSRGFEVEVASDGGRALEMHSRTPFDAIFVSSQLPALDAIALTREIRGDEDRSGRHTPIVAMTTVSMPGESERCIAAGIDYCSGRPLSPAGLDYVLDRAFARDPAATPDIVAVG